MQDKTQPIAQLIGAKVDLVDSDAEGILYGSRARGDEMPDSDWDILILTNYLVDLAIEDRFRDKIYDLELETGELISTFIYSKREWSVTHHITPFYHNVKAEGVFL